jgi:hypothetical protein
MTHLVVQCICKQPVSDRQTQHIFDIENLKEQHVSACSEVIISLLIILEERIMCNNDDSDIKTGSAHLHLLYITPSYKILMS